MEPGSVHRVSLCTRQADPLGASFYLTTFGKCCGCGEQGVPRCLRDVAVALAGAARGAAACHGQSPAR